MLNSAEKACGRQVKRFPCNNFTGLSSLYQVVESLQLRRLPEKPAIQGAVLRPWLCSSTFSML